MPNAFIQAELKPKPGEPRTVLVLRGILADMLLATDSQLHGKFIEQRNGKKTLCLIVNKALCGMAESLMLWCQELKSVLEAQGFALNPHDPCAANKKVNGS